MSGVLVDTSVWVTHFRHGEAALGTLLAYDLVMTHPLVIGEIACGTPPERRRTLELIQSLRGARQAEFSETHDLIERAALYGRGYGLVDLMLLASTMITPDARLWTLDKRLAAIAEEFGIAYAPPSA